MPHSPFLPRRLSSDERGLQAPQERQALGVEPGLADGQPVAEGGPARLEAHGGAEEERARARGLMEEEGRVGEAYPEHGEAKLEQILAVDPVGLLHDRVDAA